MPRHALSKLSDTTTPLEYCFNTRNPNFAESSDSSRPQVLLVCNLRSVRWAHGNNSCRCASMISMLHSALQHGGDAQDARWKEHEASLADAWNTRA